MSNINFSDYTILVVDDSPATVEIIKRNLETKNYKVFTSGNVSDAINVLDKTLIDLVITDLRMPGIDGINLVKHVRENFKNTEILVITGFPSVETAVKSIKFGADDYLAKPFTETELFNAVEKTLLKLYGKKELKRTRSKMPESNFGIIGNSPAIVKVFKTIEKINRVKNATVLITGKSGTGKELVARAIHYNSKSSSAPFIPVNCAAIPDELLESELFGHQKGAFTGAAESRPGFFQIANGGTIFLDEVSNTSLSMQAKLLRVIQEKEFYAVGDKKAIKVDLRIIAATNLDLTSLIALGKFREDLFYRLNVINIQLPPLSEREEDIFLLMNVFLNKYARETGREKIPTFSNEALKAIKNYNWPGNVRELQNLVYQLIVMNDSNMVEITDLPAAFRYQVHTSKEYNKSLQSVELDYISQVLESVGNNKTEAAKILNIDRKTLREKLKNNTEGRIG